MASTLFFFHVVQPAIISYRCIEDKGIIYNGIEHMRNHIYVAIMAGGVGSRFWPASRTAKPKQFLDMMGTGKSLLRQTFERFLNVTPADQIYVVTHEDYADQVMAHLPEIGVNQVITEPARRNTAPCIAYTALKINKLDPNAQLIIAPSDHIILDEQQFVKTIRSGIDFTQQREALLTLGILPSRPDTGYGYIQYDPLPFGIGVHKVLRFTEKPPLPMAKIFLESGNYLWNAGIFIWSCSAIISAFQQHAPDIIDALMPGYDQFNSPQETAFIQQVYPELPNISIDYAIIEKAENVYTIPSNFGWSDLGTWNSLHAESEKDAGRNVVQASAQLLQDTTDCIVRAPEGKLVVITGLHDFIIVDEGDVLMIYPKSREQEIKSVTNSLQARGDDQFI
jgi:mannose-1-phosphate guanylyltransferase